MREIARIEDKTGLQRQSANGEALDQLREHPIAQALAEAVQGAADMDLQLAMWANEYGFTRGPGESGSVFLARFCTYLAQMYFGMYNPGTMARICTCIAYSDNSDVEHEFPCELSREAKARKGE